MKGLQGVFHRVARRVSAVTLPAPADSADRIPIQARNATVAVIARLVQLSSRYAWPTILSFLLLAVVSATYVTRHFAIITDSKELLSSSLPWRQQERMLHNAFPQRIDQIIAVIDASTPEAADDAADALVKGLASLDRFLEKRRNWIVGTTLAATILGLPLLAGLRFDFNPLNLRAQDAESVATMLDLMNAPETSPDTLDVLRSNVAQASATAERLRQLPQVGRVLTLQSFVPEDQDAKLALIEDASFFFQNTLSPDEVDAETMPAQAAEAINNLVHDLSDAALGLGSPAAVQARRLASVLALLAAAPATALDGARHALIAPLNTTLRQVRHLLAAEHVNIEMLPPTVKQAWMSADGQARVEVAPSADANDNASLHRFVTAVRAVTSDAAGKPVFLIEAASSVVTAFFQAGILSVFAIALILFVALRRWIDVALTLVPLLVAIVVTLEICVVIGLELNFANIIALPLLLGVGVAFKIYYIVAWRSGETNFLQSSLTRAVLYSACTTAIAFGSLCFSHHPGTSSMGKLMALSLLTTLSAAVIFQPALLATQRQKRSALSNTLSS